MKEPAPFRIFGLLLVILSFLVIHPNVYASGVVFSDDFTSLDESLWSVNRNGGIVDLQEESLHLHSATGTLFPYITYNGPIIPDGKHTIETRFKFYGPLNYGSGIIFSDSLIPNGTLVDVRPTDVIFQIWPTGPTTFALWTILCRKDSVGCSDGSYTMIQSFSVNTWHSLKLSRVEDNSYTVVFDEIQLFQSNPTSKKISTFWVGSPQRTITNTTKSDIFIDYFRIKNDDQPEVNPVIILPGYGNPCPLLQQFC